MLLFFIIILTNFLKIGLFVKSKSGEIDRRVRECEKLINSIAAKDEQKQKRQQELDESSSVSSPSPQPKSLKPRDKSRQKLVFLLRQEVLQLTRDVQRLARFIGVQRTGFRKLLKKYKKWSQSSELSDKFLPILESPSSFTNQDFTSVFLELSLLYNVLRQARSSNFISRSVPSQYPNNETLCKFDCEMLTAVSASSVFWVHPDNVVEIKVALLRNLGLVSDDSAAAASLTKSSSSTSIHTKSGDSVTDLSRLNSSGTVNSMSTSNDLSATDPNFKEPSKDLSLAIYLDNPKKFNSIQTHSEPGQIRWVRGGNAEQNANNSSHVLCSPVGGLRHFCLASLSSLQSDLILRSQFDGLAKQVAAEKNNLSKLALSWVDRRKAAPISKASFNRSRFRHIGGNNQSSSTSNSNLGSSNGSQDPSDSNIFSTSPTSHMDTSDLWATLDTNIHIAKANPKDAATISFDPIEASDSDSNNNKDIVDFPYAVLEVRYKGMDKPVWLAELEESHLVYPVESFSLYAHSVTTFYAKALSQLPSWVSVLNENVDIRKSPKRRAANSGTGALSTGTTVSLNGSNERDPLLSQTSYNHKYTINSEPKVSEHQTTQEATQPVVRYWNEFDDPEDGPDDGVFVIIPDEDDEFSGVFSDHNIIQLFNLSENFIKTAHRLKNKVAKLFGFGQRQRSREDGYDSDDEDSYNSYDEDSDEYYYYNSRPGLPTIYEEEEDGHHSSGGYSDHHQRHHSHDDPENDLDYYSFSDAGHSGYAVVEQRDYVLSILYTLFFSIAFLIVVILCGLIIGNDLGGISTPMMIVFGSGLGISLVISLLALYLYFLRAQTPGIVHQALVYLAFSVIMPFSIGGIVWIIS